MSEVIKMRLQDVVMTGGGGGGSNDVWLPSVDASGNISWQKSSTSTAPETQNIKGPAGADGSDGSDGADGKSAYEIAVDEGYTGTEEEWLASLKGETGATGPQGPTGATGATGATGPQGPAGRGVSSVAVNGSNHVIVTYSDATTDDAGAVDVTVPIDDTTAAANKVYSSSKTAALLNGKFDASYTTISGGGANLCDFTQSHINWKPGMADNTSYTPGTSQNGYLTTNLWTYSSNEKLKFYIGAIPTYFRFVLYDSNYNFLMASGNYTTDTDGYYVVQMKKTGAAYMCFVMAGAESNFNTFNIGRYDTFGNLKVVINDLYLSDDNVTMVQNRLGIDTPDILRGKKWAVAGDSFTHGDGVSETIPSGTYAGQYAVYPYLIATRHQMTIQSFFENGRTLALPQDGTSTNSFAYYYQNVAADADYLTIYLGINDSHKASASTGQIPIGTATDSTTASFYGAWNVILSWLITNRPNLKIGIIVSNGCDTDDYRTAAIAMANKYGIPYIDLNGDSRTPCMLRSTNASIDATVRNQRTINWRVSSENTHPNAAAHAYEATFIEEFLKTL